MFQSFDTHADPSQGPARLAKLRRLLRSENLDGFFIPRADAHQGEYVSDADKRLEWLTGFTGSAGFCIALLDRAGVFIDGRYRNQVRGQVDLDFFTPVNWPEIQSGDWLVDNMPNGGRVGFDPWMHTIAAYEKALETIAGTGIELISGENLVNQIWADRPPRPYGKITPHPIEFTGKSHSEKRAELAFELRKAGDKAVIITQSDSIAWLLNIRGDDIAHIPIVQGFAILHDDARVDFFTHPEREAVAQDHFGPDVQLWADTEFSSALASLTGPVRVDKATGSIAIMQILKQADIAITWGDDPCALPKAVKNETEIAGSIAAHLRDGAAMVEFLTWFDHTPSKTLSEIDLVVELEARRSTGNTLKDISFETISGAGPNGAIMHYRVTNDSNRALSDGDLVVLDSGGQYLDGTTDITRTLPVGAVGSDEKICFTRVLQGMIAMSRLRWPVGLAGRDLDAIARYPLWVAHQDFNHGTGHGVGSYLSVHEGPQRLSRVGEVPFQPGMILSNEPGYYRDGAFGIRIENLIVVRQAVQPDGGDARDMLCFETLTYAPIDRRLIIAEMLSVDERNWLNAYHHDCLDKLGGRVSPEAQTWLKAACAPI